MAQTTTWINPNGGLWHDPANWSDGVPNGLSAIAVSDMATVAPLNLGGFDGSVSEWRIGASSLTLVCDTNRLAIRQLLRVGAPFAQSSLRIEGQGGGGVIHPTSYGVERIEIGAVVGSRAEVIVPSGSVFALRTIVGGEGEGYLELGGSGQLASWGSSLGRLQVARGSRVRIGDGGGLSLSSMSCAGRVEVVSGGVLANSGVFGSFDFFGPESSFGVSGPSTRLSVWAMGGECHGVIEQGARVEAGSGLYASHLSISGQGTTFVGGNLGADIAVVQDYAQVSAYWGDFSHLSVTSGANFRMTEALGSPEGVYTVAGQSLLEIGALWHGTARAIGPGAVLSVGGVYSVVEVGAGAELRSLPGGPLLVMRLLPQLPAYIHAESGARVQVGDTVVVGARMSLDEGAELHVPTLTLSTDPSFPFDSVLDSAPGSEIVCNQLSIARGSSTGLFTASGSMTGNITLDGILRPAGFALNGSVTASSTGLTEISLDVPTPAITATGACNLAAGLLIVTRDGPTLTGETWPIIAAGSLSLGDIALPTLPPDLEWDLTQTPTSLSITAVPTAARCRPSVERLSPAAIDGYIGDPIHLAAAVSGPVTSMRWHKDGLPLADGGIYTGTATPTLAIASGASVNLARYHLIATGPCGKTASLPIDASVRCGGDFNQDFSVDGDDVIDFFGPWDAGEIAADWNHDGAVDGDDVIGFFAKWDAGC